MVLRELLQPQNAKLQNKNPYQYSIYPFFVGTPGLLELKARILENVTKNALWITGNFIQICGNHTVMYSLAVRHHSQRIIRDVEAKTLLL